MYINKYLIMLYIGKKAQKFFQKVLAIKRQFLTIIYT